jgi:hypothetical protein
MASMPPINNRVMSRRYGQSFHIHVGLLRRFSELAVFDARLYVRVRRVDQPAQACGVCVALPGLSFTWRMNLPVPCNVGFFHGAALPDPAHFLPSKFLSALETWPNPRRSDGYEEHFL